MISLLLFAIAIGSVCVFGALVCQKKFGYVSYRNGIGNYCIADLWIFQSASFGSLCCTDIFDNPYDSIYLGIDKE